jgi:mRNA-degrading endonuclease RelE of RelBE toxin-antitoxin system
MPFSVEFSPEAISHLDALRNFDRQAILHSVDEHLTIDPIAVTRRKKLMRTNLIASGELRTGNFRIYYDVDVDQAAVLIRAIGVKVHNRVFIAGEPADLS